MFNTTTVAGFLILSAVATLFVVALCCAGRIGDCQSDCRGDDWSPGDDENDA